MKRISIVGLGYIGLPTAISAAQVGYDVYGYDIDAEKIKNINAGNPTIIEPEIYERLWKALKSGNFKAFSELQYADCFVIAVPTPFKPDNKTADLSYVLQAGQAIAKCLMPGNLVIVESTVPVGATATLAMLLEEESGLKNGIDFFIAHCPERVLPSKIFKELAENDRVIGGMCQRSCDLAHQFYAKFVKGFLHVTDDKSAEMVKLIENTSRDVQIAFANQVDAMCQRAGLDTYHVIELANKHPRVKILNPTCGVGGHCIAVDPWFLVESFPEDTQLLQAARAINDAKPYHVIDKVLRKVATLKQQGNAQPKVLALGLAFKPDVDDIRQSPALLIAQELNEKKDALSLVVHDHMISKEQIAQHQLASMPDLWQAIAWADIVVILVKHKEFMLITHETLHNKIVIDTCGLLHDTRTKQSHAMLEGATKTRLENLFGS